MLYLQFLDSEIKFIDRREGIKKWGTKGPHPDQVQVETETNECTYQSAFLQLQSLHRYDCKKNL